MFMPKKHTNNSLCSILRHTMFLSLCVTVLLFLGCKDDPEDFVKQDIKEDVVVDNSNNSNNSSEENDNNDDEEDVVVDNSNNSNNSSEENNEVDNPDVFDVTKDANQWIDFTGTTNILEYLESSPMNTPDSPYHLRIKGVNLSTNGSRGSTLRTLYDSLVRYVELDLSGSTGERISNITVGTAPNKKNIVSIILPTSITRVELNVFSGCENLVSAELPNVTYIGHGAFSRLSNLKSVKMPMVQVLNTTNTSTSGVFYDCTSLTEVFLPNIESIGNHAFNRSGLVKITLGSNTPPDLLGADVFRNARNLAYIFVPEKALSNYQNTEKENWGNLKGLLMPVK